MKKSILLLTDEMEPGGVPRHVVDIANGIIEEGIIPIVAASDGPFRLLLHKEIIFVNLPLYLPGTGGKRMMGFIDSYKILAPVIRREKIVLIHSHKRYTDILGRVLARRMSLPHISTCHNTFSSLKRISVFGDVTIACSKAAEEMLIKEFHKDPKTVTQIYSGISPLRKFNEDEKSRALNGLKIPRGSMIIASIGQLIESKDRATLIHAASILKKRNEIGGILFAILGDGEQKEMLEALADKQEVQDHILFLHSMFDVETLFNIADFMVLSSKREGLPYVLMEAASIGKPHIATDVGGVSEFVIHGETGILVPPSNPKELADAIKDLLDNPEKVINLGKNARAKFSREFTYERFIRETIEVYKANSADQIHGL